MSPPSKTVKIDIPFASDHEIETLVWQFESCRWPYERWTHRAHIALGVWMLKRLSFDEAVDRVRQAIQRYNRTCGDPNGYHETLTLFFMTMIQVFLNNRPNEDSECALVEGFMSLYGKSVALEHYSAERLWSLEAKTLWIEPDLKPLPVP